MKKKITLYYDDEDENDIKLLKFINGAKGKTSRSAFIMNTLNDLMNDELVYKRLIAPTPPQYIIEKGLLEQFQQEQKEENSKKNFKRILGKE